MLQEQGSLLELVDPSLGSGYSEDEALRMLNLALVCANPSPTLRPSMSSVVSMLEGRIPVQAPLVKRGGTNEDMRFKALENSRELQRVVSMDGPWVDTSASLSSNRDESRDNLVGLLIHTC